MFGLAYVILPFSEVSPAEAIAESLARFRRGRRGDVPDDWLRFHDETAHVREMHEACFTFTRDVGLRIEGGESWHLNTQAVADEMVRRDRQVWRVRFADIEPDLGAFVSRFAHPLDRHPATGGFGRWLNGLGQWDWWDLGGCFDGEIIGSRGRKGRGVSGISSGPGPGRAAFETLAGALEEACGQEPGPEIDLRNDDNIELVESLLDTFDQEGGPRLPSTIVLPPGVVPDEERWISEWPSIVDHVGDPAWHAHRRQSIRELYQRYRDHWVAAIAYHF